MSMTHAVKRTFTSSDWKHELGFKIFWYKTSTETKSPYFIFQVCNITCSYTLDFMESVLIRDNAE